MMRSIVYSHVRVSWKVGSFRPVVGITDNGFPGFGAQPQSMIGFSREAPYADIMDCGHAIWNEYSKVRLRLILEGRNVISRDPPQFAGNGNPFVLYDQYGIAYRRPSNVWVDVDPERDIVTAWKDVIDREEGVGPEHGILIDNKL